MNAGTCHHGMFGQLDSYRFMSGYRIRQQAGQTFLVQPFMVVLISKIPHSGVTSDAGQLGDHSTGKQIAEVLRKMQGAVNASVNIGRSEERRVGKECRGRGAGAAWEEKREQGQ